MTGRLKMTNSPDIADLKGLESITSVGGTLKIDANNALEILNLDNLCSVGGDFFIRDNDKPCNSLAIEL